RMWCSFPVPSARCPSCSRPAFITRLKGRAMMRSFLHFALLGAACLGLAVPAQAQTEGWGGKAKRPDYRTPDYQGAVFPPWQHGANNDAINRGLEFTVPEVDVLADFHGDLTDPKLVLYVGGNYFFAMAPLVQAFETSPPDYKGHIYWETMPPGLLLRQIRQGGTITVGNMTWTVPADAYFAGLQAVNGL